MDPPEPPWKFKGRNLGGKSVVDCRDPPLYMKILWECDFAGGVFMRSLLSA